MSNAQNTTIEFSAFSFNSLRTFAKENGVTVHNPNREKLETALRDAGHEAPFVFVDETMRTLEDAIALSTESATPARKVKNLGYEGKVALRLARFHPQAPEEKILRGDLQLRFKLFMGLRPFMTVSGEASDAVECACCGRTHLHHNYFVSIPGHEDIVVGDDCIENLAYINGSGCSSDYRRKMEWDRTEGAILDGSVTKNDLRIHRMRISRGVVGTKFDLDPTIPECEYVPIR